MMPLRELTRSEVSENRRAWCPPLSMRWPERQRVRAPWRQACSLLKRERGGEPSGPVPWPSIVRRRTRLNHDDWASTALFCRVL